MDDDLLRQRAGSIIDALAENVMRLPARDSQEEAVVTAVADLALFASVLQRDNGAPSRALAAALQALLANETFAPDMSSPGPAEWALHAARTWLDPRAERRRLLEPGLNRLVIDSRRRVFALGPAWRPEEVAYVDARLTGAPLPALRNIPLDESPDRLYEVAHVAFYATDFGAVPPKDPLAPALGRAAARMAKTLAGADGAWDVGIELVLAARFLSGRWPTESSAWIESIVPVRSESALAALRRSPEQFLSLYHPLALSAVALMLAARNGTT